MAHPALVGLSGALALGLPYGDVPLHFERNAGQTDAHVRYLARGAGYALFLTDTAAVFSLRGRVLRVTLDGGRAAPQVDGVDLLPGRSQSDRRMESR